MMRIIRLAFASPRDAAAMLAAFVLIALAIIVLFSLEAPHACC